MERNFPKLSKVLLAVLLVAVSLISWEGASAQSREIRGKVTSKNTGDAIIGASVTVEGTTIGVSTGADGSYLIDVPASTTALTYSFLGYESEVVEIGSRTTIDVALAESSTEMDEVVVVGYGVQKKKLTTGANLNIKADDIMKRSTADPIRALQGQTPGMQITSTSGQPGESLKVTIRGLGTTGSSGPLYIVDGIPGDISKINPADIESIDVLKDAASAAIYGSQAANGVVLVTTKQGKEGTAQVYYDGYCGIQTVYRDAQMLNAEQYKVLMDESALNSGKAAHDWSLYDTADTDWVKQMFRKSAPTQNHTVGITGGGKTSVYAISFNYTDQQGLVGSKEKSRYESYKFRTNTEHRLYKDILKVGQHFTFVYGTQAGIGVGNQYNNTLRGAFNTSPLAPVYGDNLYDWGDEGGEWNDSSLSDKTWYNNDGNPYASMMLGRSETKSTNVMADVYAELTPVKGLTIRSTFGISYYGSRGHGISFPAKWNSYGTTPSLESDYYADVNQSQSNGISMSWINTATYETTFGDGHNFLAMVGSEWDTNEGEWMYGNNKIAVEQFKDFEHAWLNNGTSDNSYWGKPQGNVNDIDRTMSVFGRIGYNYKERYIVNVTLRGDASSKFAKGNRWGIFPSVSAGWVLTEEAWAKDSRWLDFFKIRGSWGQVGNKNISNYAYTAPISTNNHTYNFGTGLGSSAEVIGAIQERLANSDIRWETSEQLDFGFDARLFRDRFGIAFDWYRKTTRDWLIEAPIIATAGTGAPYINGGDVLNTGVELALNWSDNAGDFHYYIGVNGAYNKNTVGNIPNTDGIIHGQSNMLFDNAKEFYRAENGHSIGYWWGLETDGIFQNQQEIDEWKAAGNGILQGNVAPGDVRFVDQNHDGKINDDDKVDLGNGMPSFTYGFSLGFDWKGLDFNVTAYGAAGNKIVQSYRNHANAYANFTTAALDRWTGEGTSNRMPRVEDTASNWKEFSDLYLQDGSYLRISNITLGYDFATLTNVSWLGQLRLYFSVQNPFTFTKYDGMDPEIGYGMDSWVSGVDLGYYPHPRTYLVGLNIKF
ncbi:MAG: TonB-dependent receptor [Alistipes sp.]|nr:TonB-dependent receptor [Alistipes sp.]